MTIYVQSHRGDGTTVVVDTADASQFVIQTRDWPAVAGLPNEEQRAALEALTPRAGPAPEGMTNAAAAEQESGRC